MDEETRAVLGHITGLAETCIEATGAAGAKADASIAVAGLLLGVLAAQHTDPATRCQELLAMIEGKLAGLRGTGPSAEAEMITGPARNAAMDVLRTLAEAVTEDIMDARRRSAP